MFYFPGASRQIFLNSFVYKWSLNPWSSAFDFIEFFHIRFQNLNFVHLDLTKANHASLPREREEDTRLSGEPLLMDNLRKLKSKIVGLEGEKLALTKKLEDSTEFNSWLSAELKKLNDHVLMLNDHVHKYIDQASVPTTIGPQAKMEIPESSTAPTLVNEANEFLAEMLG
ncbi:hypothetical protein R1sor_018042 [Riccia sorocarpa]|uniref:Uncharacterized protein n=1 Tax=Riccia sorocarpa TaxID=122646 RepID=A0ABD3I8K2_9MARC